MLVAVDFFADRAIRRDYERTGFEQLQAIAQLAQANPPELSALPPEKPEEAAALETWVQHIAASGARVTVDGLPKVWCWPIRSLIRKRWKPRRAAEIVQAFAEEAGDRSDTVQLCIVMVYLAVRRSDSSPVGKKPFCDCAARRNGGTTAGRSGKVCGWRRV